MKIKKNTANHKNIFKKIMYKILGKSIKADAFVLYIKMIFYYKKLRY